MVSETGVSCRSSVGSLPVAGRFFPKPYIMPAVVLPQFLPQRPSHIDPPRAEERHAFRFEQRTLLCPSGSCAPRGIDDPVAGNSCRGCAQRPAHSSGVAGKTHQPCYGAVRGDSPGRYLRHDLENFGVETTFSGDGLHGFLYCIAPQTPASVIAEDGEVIPTTRSP